MRDFDDIFTFSQNGSCPDRVPSHVALNLTIEKPEDRTRAVADVIKVLADQGIIPGIRDEVLCVNVCFYHSSCLLHSVDLFFPLLLLRQLYPVKPSFDAPVFFSLERAAAPYFGLKVITILD